MDPLHAAFLGDNLERGLSAGSFAGPVLRWLLPAWFRCWVSSPSTRCSPPAGWILMWKASTEGPGVGARDDLPFAGDSTASFALLLALQRRRRLQIVRPGSAAISLSFPIFDGFLTMDKVIQAKSRLAITELEKKQLLDRVDEAVHIVDGLEETISELAHTVTSANTHARQLKNSSCGTKWIQNQEVSRTSFRHVFGRNPAT